MRASSELYLHWKDQGLPAWAAWGLSEAGCTTPDDVRRLGRDHVAKMREVGPASLAKIERAIGGWGTQTRKLQIYHPDTGRTLHTLTLTTEDVEALGQLAETGRHLRALVVGE